MVLPLYLFQILVGDVFFFFFLAALVLHCGACGLSPVAVSAGYSPVVPGLITAVASLKERGFYGPRASVVVVHGLWDPHFRTRDQIISPALAAYS